MLHYITPIKRQLHTPREADGNRVSLKTYAYRSKLRNVSHLRGWKGGRGGILALPRSVRCPHGVATSLDRLAEPRTQITAGRAGGRAFSSPLVRLGPRAVRQTIPSQPPAACPRNYHCYCSYYPLWIPPDTKVSSVDPSIHDGPDTKVRHALGLAVWSWVNHRVKSLLLLLRATSIFPPCRICTVY